MSDLFMRHITTASTDKTFLQYYLVIASELKDNLEELFPLYYVHTDVSSSIRIHKSVLLVAKGLTRLL